MAFGAFSANLIQQMAQTQWVNYQKSGHLNQKQTHTIGQIHVDPLMCSIQDTKTSLLIVGSLQLFLGGFDLIHSNHPL